MNRNEQNGKYSTKNIFHRIRKTETETTVLITWFSIASMAVTIIAIIKYFG